VSRTNGSTKPLQQVLELLEGVRPGTNGYTALCPAHDDTKPSLSVSEADGGKVLLKCFAGCDTQDIVEVLGLDMTDLFPRDGTKPPGKGSNGPGLTLEEYAEAKRLPIKFLHKLGIGQIYLEGTPAVRMPYMNVDGTAPATRMRVSLNGDSRFRWKTGSKPILYGLWRIERARKQRYVCLVEGESDAQTLWCNRWCALGLPGAATWTEQWVEHLEDIDDIYVVVEPDRGGEAVLGWLRKSKIRDRARLVMLGGVKDPSELYLSSPENFSAAWRQALERAVPWTELEEREDKVRKKVVWEKCKRLAQMEDILEEFLEALERQGVAGERRAAGIIFLALISRFLSRPVSLVVTAPSSAGKSFTVERVLGFLPASGFYALTAMSERALAYSAEPLSHRFLVLYEGAALQGDFLNYLVRSLLSEGRLRYETVEKTPEGLQARLIEREGPTGLIMTATAVNLHPENETRHLTIPLSDTPAQTRRILRAIAAQHTDNHDQQKTCEEMVEWHALQEWLEYAAHEVVVPYACVLAELIPPVAVRLRRDFTAILNLIEAHSLLHQATRKTDKSGRIIARLADYGAVRELISEIISEGVEQTVRKTIRQTVKAVAEICSESAEHPKKEWDDAGGATVLQVAKMLHLDRSSASRRVKQALARGYLKNLETKRGQPHRLVIADPLPGERPVMPTPEEVLEQWKRMR
jgi:hypothetical protein